MKTKHTHGPWKIDREYEGMCLGCSTIAGIGEYSQTIIGETWPQGDHTDASSLPNAQRIVACVNAMEGIENPADFVRQSKAALELSRKL